MRRSKEHSRGHEFLFARIAWYFRPALRNGLSILPPPATMPTTARHLELTTSAPHREHSGQPLSPSTYSLYQKADGPSSSHPPHVQ